ncbi:MAG: coproporphyrinogen dehydrogenase HemZ [Clostridiales bacterium]|nr:coproporphyrinogen dehydrogenase HemZ [Clostridiales bacterium]
MKFVIIGGISEYDVQVMAQVFFHHLPFEMVEEVPNHGLCLHVEICGTGEVTATLFDSGSMIAQNTATGAKPVALAIYRVLAEFTGYRPPWGLLTGIRPVKLISAMNSSGLGRKEAVSAMISRYLVDETRAELCADVAAVQARIMQASPQNSVSIYISVPFCPTICHYCSFSAYPVSKFGNRMEAYLAALLAEIAYLGEICRGRPVENIYIGGGTPTALDVKNFRILLEAIDRAFDTGKALEYTVEAGRPDTVCAEKLALMRDFGVGRISINPQTLKGETLRKIGRGHTVSEFHEAYNLAKSFGFEHINFDLILGLPDETLADIEATFSGICALNPNSVTIHNLAIKRASKFHTDIPQLQKQTDMLALSREFMGCAGLVPYYLYRQKNSPGNFENVGYSRPGFEGRYNIHMMEETRSVLAAGCGAITKLVDLEANRIERIVNLRDLDQYIQRVDEMIARKGDIFG